MALRMSSACHFGHHPAAIIAIAVAPTAVIEAKASIAGRAELLEHHDVVLGLVQAEKTGTLDDSWKGLTLIRIGQIKHARELIAFAVKIHFFCAHNTS